jgi:hypothetical protein
MFRLFTQFTWLFKYSHYIIKDLLCIQISIEAWKMYWVFHTWYEGLCRSAMKFMNNSCQRAWTKHMACKQKCKQKMAWSHIKPKGQCNDHNYLLHIPCMTRIRNIIVLLIILKISVVNPIQMVQRKLYSFKKAIGCNN